MQQNSFLYLDDSVAMPTTTCYEGDGSNYRGVASTTEKGTQCINWVLSTSINPITHPYKVGLRICCALEFIYED